MKRKTNIWSGAPSPKDLEAASDYLSLLVTEDQLGGLISQFRRSPTIMRGAKDLLRASQTALLDEDNPHVADNLKRIKKGKKLSPVFSIRGNAAAGVTLTIADGHHRICASWYWNENEPVACQLIEFPPNHRSRNPSPKGSKARQNTRKKTGRE